MIYDDHKTQPLSPVPGTNKRIGVEHLITIDRFWRSNRSGQRIGRPLGTIEARSFENDFCLTLEDGDSRGLTYTNASYAVLLQTLLLAYDGK
jgi:hypothetical protein